MAEQFGNQPERLVRAAQARAQHIEKADEQREQPMARQSIAYAMEKNFDGKRLSMSVTSCAMRSSVLWAKSQRKESSRNFSRKPHPAT